MSHLSTGAIRSMLDDPDRLSEQERSHLQECAECKDAASAVISQAHRAAKVMESSSKPEVDAPAALAALRAQGLGRLAASSHRRPLLFGRRFSRPVLTGGLAGVLVLGLVGAGVAGNFVKIFEPEEVVAVRVDPMSLNSLPDLNAFGSFSYLEEPDVSQVEDLDAAAEVTGLDLLAPQELPKELGAQVITVTSTGRISFTFDAARAAFESGDAFPPELYALDGSSLTLKAGPAVIQVFGGAELVEYFENTQPPAAGEVPDLTSVLGALPDLTIVQMAPPVLSSDGPSVQEYRDALLSLPDLSPGLKSQIEAIADPSSTLPVPIPADLARASEVEIDGHPGLVVGDNTGVGSAVVWRDDDAIRAVGAPLPVDEVLAIARSMR